jgi:hypothetical protein
MFNFFQKNPTPNKDTKNYYISGYKPGQNNSQNSSISSKNSSTKPSSIQDIDNQDQQNDLPSYYLPTQNMEKFRNENSTKTFPVNNSKTNYVSEIVNYSNIQKEEILEDDFEPNTNPGFISNSQLSLPNKNTIFDQNDYYSKQSLLDPQELSLQKEHYKKTLENLKPKVISTLKNDQQKYSTNIIDEEMLSFLDILSISILGYSLEEIPEEKLEFVMTECSNIFSEYIINYVENRYGKVEAIRLRAGQKFPQSNIFTQFKQLGGIFDEAFLAFKDFLLKDWQNQNAF